MVKVVGNSQGQIYTSNGKALQSTGTSPVIDNLTVIPSTSSQTITAPEGINGYNPITVNAVTSDIDQNIIASNIKKNVEILGVTGDYEGIIPSGTLNITSNNNYDVTNYANANVNVPISGFTDIPSYEIDNGTLKRKTYTLTGHEFDNVTTVDDYGLYYAFSNCNLIGNINFENLINIGKWGLYRSFEGCSNLTTVDLSNLTNINQPACLASTFAGCTSLTTIDLSNLTNITGNGVLYDTFYRCTNLQNISFPNLSILNGDGILSQAFRVCTSLTDIYFNALTTTSFGSYINQFSGMLYNTGNKITHTLHFPVNVESTIQGLTGYPLFGGTSGYVVGAFDLPATS